MNRRNFIRTAGTVAVGISVAGCGEPQEATGDQIQLDPPSLGESDAPQLLAFEDLGCSYCARFHQNVYPSLKRDYIDTGEVQYVFNDFVLPAGQYSSQSHQYARGVQDVVGAEAFFEYIDYIFTNQGQVNVEFLQSGLSQITDSQDEIEQIQANAEDRRYQSAIESGSTLGEQFGVSGTPRFVLNESLIEDVSPYSVFSAEVDSRL